MCILFIYTDPNPPKGGYRLIIASNRDEFYKRPARKAYRCPETGIIGGRDLEPGREGGMWLGLSVRPPRIKFGALLNVTGEEKRPATAGRGPLVLNYLQREQPPLDYIEDVKKHGYSAYNLVMLEVARGESRGYHFSNSPEALHEFPGAQVLAFGNSTPSSPFTKVKNGREKFREVVENCGDRDALVGGLLALLKSRDLHLPDPELARRAPNALDFLSSVFVKMEDGGYGTRTHSVVLVDEDCNVEFVEHTMKEPIDVSSPEWEITEIKSRL